MPRFHKLNWIEFAALSGVLYFVFGLLAGILFFFSFLSFVIFSTLSQVSLMLFFSGFIVLGDKYDKMSIKASSWVIIGTGFLFLFGFLFLVSFPEVFLGLFGFSLDSFFPNITRPGTSLMTETFSAAFVALAETYVAAYRIIVVVFNFWLVCLVAGVSFGIGLIDLTAHIKMARLAGASMIVGSVLSIVGVGVLVLFFAVVLGVVVLLEESERDGVV